MMCEPVDQKVGRDTTCSAVSSCSDSTEASLEERLAHVSSDEEDMPASCSILHEEEEECTITAEPDGVDQKGNRYYRRKLIAREFLQDDLIRVTFELPKDTSLLSLGIDSGLGDFVRIRPYSDEDRELVDNPNGGRAYSPVSLPSLKGEFSLIVKVYGTRGVSAMLKKMPIGGEVLATNHVEHVLWKERNKGYYANERGIDALARQSLPVYHDDAHCNVGLIAFGVGITEIAPVAISELRDPRIKKVTVLWALKFWKDALWVQTKAKEGQPQDLVRQLFADAGNYGERLEICFILSQEQRENCFHGRINQDVLEQVFCKEEVPKESLRFLTTGTLDMMAFAYNSLANLGLDIKKEDNWAGSNLLFQKLRESDKTCSRLTSPLAGITSMSSSRGYSNATDEDIATEE